MAFASSEGITTTDSSTKADANVILNQGQDNPTAKQTTATAVVTDDEASSSSSSSSSSTDDPSAAPICLPIASDTITDKRQQEEDESSSGDEYSSSEDVDNSSKNDDSSSSIDESSSSSEEGDTRVTRQSSASKDTQKRDNFKNQIKASSTNDMTYSDKVAMGTVDHAEAVRRLKAAKLARKSKRVSSSSSQAATRVPAPKSGAGGSSSQSNQHSSSSEEDSSDSSNAEENIPTARTATGSRPARARNPYPPPKVPSPKMARKSQGNDDSSSSSDECTSSEDADDAETKLGNRNENDSSNDECSNGEDEGGKEHSIATEAQVCVPVSTAISKRSPRPPNEEEDSTSDDESSSSEEESSDEEDEEEENEGTPSRSMRAPAPAPRPRPRQQPPTKISPAVTKRVIRLSPPPPTRQPPSPQPPTKHAMRLSPHPSPRRQPPSPQPQTKHAMRLSPPPPPPRRQPPSPQPPTKRPVNTSPPRSPLVQLARVIRGVYDPETDPQLEAKGVILDMLTHGVNCQARGRCRFPNCTQARTMIRHISKCKASNCTISYCAKSQFVLRHGPQIQAALQKRAKVKAAAADPTAASAASATNTSPPRNTGVPKRQSSRSKRLVKWVPGKLASIVEIENEDSDSSDDEEEECVESTKKRLLLLDAVNAIVGSDSESESDDSDSDSESSSSDADDDDNNNEEEGEAAYDNQETNGDRPDDTSSSSRSTVPTNASREIVDPDDGKKENEDGADDSESQTTSYVSKNKQDDDATNETQIQATLSLDLTSVQSVKKAEIQNDVEESNDNDGANDADNHDSQFGAGPTPLSSTLKCGTAVEMKKFDCVSDEEAQDRVPEPKTKDVPRHDGGGSESPDSNDNQDDDDGNVTPEKNGFDKEEKGSRSTCLNGEWNVVSSRSPTEKGPSREMSTPIPVTIAPQQREENDEESEPTQVATPTRGLETDVPKPDFEATAVQSGHGKESDMPDGTASRRVQAGANAMIEVSKASPVADEITANHSVDMKPRRDPIRRESIDYTDSDDSEGSSGTEGYLTAENTLASDEDSYYTDCDEHSSTVSATNERTEQSTTERSINKKILEQSKQMKEPSLQKGTELQGDNPNDGINCGEAAEGESVYHNVRRLKRMGSLVLSCEGLRFKAEDEHLLISWHLFWKQQLTAPPHTMLRILLWSGKSYTFKVADRKTLERLRSDVKNWVDRPRAPNSPADSEGSMVEVEGVSVAFFDSPQHWITRNEANEGQRGTTSSIPSTIALPALPTPVAYRPVYFKSQEGSLSLDEKHVLFQSSWLRRTLPYDCIAKALVSPDTHAKGLLKLVSGDERAITFELEDRDLMKKIQREIYCRVLNATARREAKRKFTGKAKRGSLFASHSMHKPRSRRKTVKRTKSGDGAEDELASTPKRRSKGNVRRTRSLH